MLYQWHHIKYSGSNGNIMSFHIFKKLYPRSTKEQLAAMETKKLQIKKIQQHNNTTTRQVYSKNRKQQNKNVQFLCSSQE